MPQTSNKFSSIIGIVLLIAVIGFTVFINFFVDKSINQQNNKENSAFEYIVLEERDLISLWKLKDLDTNPLTIDPKKPISHIGINESFKFEQYDSLISSEMFKKIPDSLKHLSEIFNEGNQQKAIINYGTLSLKHDSKGNYIGTPESIKIKNYDINFIDSTQLMEIGKMLLKYQIDNISTPTSEQFTKIDLKDGRKLFLIRKAIKIQDDYYRNILGNAIYLNDSTRIIYPSHK
ncbi:hypothetical protein V9L05_22320 (plasmid) [Bernardetia sp. Wsw4-3y2]|uniref:hypothetical protein n=1 Tax=Bernardetia sp. Wsw4-3y2 TaxID=3127471 RepID=UPI0030D5662B